MFPNKTGRPNKDVGRMSREEKEWYASIQPLDGGVRREDGDGADGVFGDTGEMISG